LDHLRRENELLRMANAKLKDELEDSQLYRGIAENRLRLLEKKVLILEQRWAALNSQNETEVLKETEVPENRRSRRRSPRTRVNSRCLMPTLAIANHSTTEQVKIETKLNKPFTGIALHNGHKLNSKPLPTTLTQPKALTNGRISCALKITQLGFEPKSLRKKVVACRRNRTRMTKEQRRELIVKALSQCSNQRGTLEDIEMYIKTNTNFIQPSRSQLLGVINHMCRYQQGIEKTRSSNRIGDSIEWGLVEPARNLKRKIENVENTMDKSLKKKRHLYPNSVKRRAYTKRQRPSTWVYCNHCHEKHYLKHLKYDVRYKNIRLRHKCKGGKYVTLSLKNDKNRLCNHNHTGGCLRLLKKGEIPLMAEEQIAKIKSDKLEPSALDKVSTEGKSEINSGGGWWPFQTAIADEPPPLEGTQDIWEAQVNRDHQNPHGINDSWNIWGTKASGAKDALRVTAQPKCKQEVIASQNDAWDPKTSKTSQSNNGEKGIQCHREKDVLENKQEDKVMIPGTGRKTDPRCQARFREDRLWYDATITARHPDGTVDVEFGDKTKQTRCQKEEIAAAVPLPLNSAKLNPEQSSLPALIPENSHDIVNQ